MIALLPLVVFIPQRRTAHMLPVQLRASSGGSLLLMWVVEGGVAVMEAVATAVSQQGKFGSP